MIEVSTKDGQVFRYDKRLYEVTFDGLYVVVKSKATYIAKLVVPREELSYVVTR